MPSYLDIAITAVCIILLRTDASAHAAPVPDAVWKSADVVRPIDETFRAVREIREARRAIFEGVPDKAAIYIGEARADMQAVQRQAKDFAVPVGKHAEEEDTYIPLDVLLVLSKGFKPTREARMAVEAANRYIAKGEYRLAIAVLKTANVDVTVSATLIPANASLRSVEAAGKLTEARKYCEASQALKAVEDSFIVETYGTDSAPMREQ
ncbi:YfdX family protein [Shinella sp. AETb1-6]|uniref:YfdX family protein n=1 Tax=Shinella sp. AETb1-6 TaxID=2692210 RepID=UPI001371717F|nr:YfdX family protein [Shinella sp. AETb1-6]MXN52780.1 YfdX family protein [Shinella sp. AETb1-6]